MLNIDSIILDDEFRNLLPPLTDEQRERLKALYVSDGAYHSPLIVWLNHGILVDGYNRYGIWVEMGSDPLTCPDILEKYFASREDALNWARQNQLGRRNLNTAQQAALALSLKGQVQEPRRGRRKLIRENSHELSESPQDGAYEQLAHISGISSNTLRRTETVLADGDEETKRQVLSGELSVNAAYKKVKNGQVVGAVFDDHTLVDRHISALRKALDKRLKTFPGSDEHFTAGKRALSQFNNAMLRWREATRDVV